MKKSHEKQAKPACPNIGDEHGAIVISGLGKVVQVAFGAALVHVKGFDERPAAGFKNFRFVATRAF